MSYLVYQGEEPFSWRTYDSSNYDSYDRPYGYERHAAASLVPVRVIERGYIDPNRALRHKTTSAFWDRSDNRLNYVVYPEADDYHHPTSSSYNYNYYGQSTADDYGSYSTGTYDHRRRNSSFKDHNSYGRSAAYDYSYSGSPEYSEHYYHSDNYPSSSYSRRNDHPRYRSYDAYGY